MTPPSDDLRVPKLLEAVELLVTGTSEPERVQVFVAEQRAASSFDRQRILDVLEGQPSFLPVVADKGSRIINKATVLWAAIDLADGSLPVEEIGEGVVTGETREVLYDQRKPVDVELAGGGQLSGDLLYSPPPGQSRVFDYLNREGRFLRLWTEARVYLINKEHITAVIDRSQTEPNDGES